MKKRCLIEAEWYEKGDITTNGVWSVISMTDKSIHTNGTTISIIDHLYSSCDRVVEFGDEESYGKYSR